MALNWAEAGNLLHPVSKGGPRHPSWCLPVLSSPCLLENLLKPSPLWDLMLQGSLYKPFCALVVRPLVTCPPCPLQHSDQSSRIATPQASGLASKLRSLYRRFVAVNSFTHPAHFLPSAGSLPPESPVCTPECFDASTPGSTMNLGGGASGASTVVRSGEQFLS